MTANYISISLSREQRLLAHVTPLDLLFLFDNTDVRSITAAKDAADALYDRLLDIGIAAPVGVWLYCDMLDLPVIGGDPTVIYESKKPERPRKPPESIARKWAGGRIGEVRQ